MAKRLNYQIGVTADTSKFEASLEPAIRSLQELGTKSQMVPTLQKASTAALDLAKNLQNATNADTGKLDLSKFNKSLATSGQTLNSYYKQLSQLGIVGNEAFLKVAKAITEAELPLRRTNTLMNSLWITMKNTARWQLTSSVLHGFVGSLETAYGYTKDLNRSLNEIRIVSGKSADDMAKFAEQANKAAKALSTTTVDYTDASLIYYQQGLSDEEVKEKTDLTIKMANVAGESADIVSDQLTAVWNNFYESGTQSLTHYADAMVALGAATASSTDEIAGGLEKFASIADMIGLSFDYAASALATITAVTRQSEDVVGTALKTIFARIQGLSLGETLEDGTDLNKYSKALDSVGISIKEDNGELKDMNNILDEIGSKWDTLAKDQQVALAQTVAGVRQYNQLVSLMDNWDFFKENLATAQGSEGELDRQAQVYAESWQAARDRVKAAAEDIYDSVINPDLFIGLDDVFTPLLSGVADVIDAMGGLKGMLPAIVLFMNQAFGDKIAQSLRDMADQVSFLTNREQIRTRSLQEQAAVLSKSISIEKMGVEGPAREVLNITQQQVELQGLVNSKVDSLNEHQKAILQQDMNHLKSLQEQSAEYAKQIDLNDRLSTKYGNLIKNNLTTENKGSITRYLNRKTEKDSDGKKVDIDENTAKINKEIVELIKNTKTAKGAVEKMMDELTNTSKAQAKLQAISDRIVKLSNGSETLTDDLKQVAYELLGVNESATDKQIVESFENADKVLEELTAKSRVLKNTLEHFLSKEDISLITRYISAIKQGASAQEALNYATKEYKVSADKMEEGLNNGSYAAKDWADTIVSVGNGLSQVAMGIQAVQSLGSVFQDSDMSTGERLITIFTSLSMLLPLLTTGINLLNGSMGTLITLENGELVVKSKSILKSLQKVVAEKLLAKAIDDTAKKTAIANAQFAAGIIALAPYIALIAGLGLVLWQAVEAYNADADAAEEASKSAEILSSSYEDAKNSATELKNTISNWNEAINNIGSLTKGTQEYADAVENANEKAKELIETYNLFNSENWYKDSNGLIQFKDNVLEDIQNQADQRARASESSYYGGLIYSNQANLKSQATNLGRTLSTESGITVERTQGTHAGMTSVRRQLNSDEILSAMELLNQQDGLTAPNELVEKFNELIPGLNLTIDSLQDFKNGLETLSQSMDKASESNKYYSKEILKNRVEELYSKDIQENDSEHYDAIIEGMAAYVSGALENGALDIKVNKNDYANNKKLSNYLGYDINSNEELTREYATKVAGVNNSELLIYKQDSNTGNLQTVAGNNVFGESISFDEMRKQLAQQKAIDDMINNLSVDGKGIEELEDFRGKISEILKTARQVGNDFGGVDFSSFVINSLSAGKIDLSSIIGQLSSSDKERLMSTNDIAGMLGFDDATLKVLGQESADSFNKAFHNQLNQDWKEEDYFNFISSAATTGEENARTLIEGLQSGDITAENIGENESYTNLLNQLETIKKEFPELEAYYIELSKTWEVGTQKFTEALEIVQDKLANIKLSKLVNEADEARKKVKDFLGDAKEDWSVKINADPEEFLDTMDDLLDADYAVNVEVHSQAEQEFDSISNAIEQIEEQASKIGENYVVAASDIRELNKTFPGIIEGMEAVGDGSVKLKDTVVKNAIASARTEVAKDAETTVEKLSNQAKQLRAKEVTYRKMAEAAKVLAGQEVETDMDAADARAILDEGLNSLEQENDQITTDYQLDNQEGIANSSKDNGQVVADNWTSAYKEAAASSKAFADAAILNMQSAANGVGATTKGVFETVYKGSSGKSAEAQELQDLRDTLDSSDKDAAQAAAAKLAEKYTNMADYLGSAASDIEGMVGQIGAQLVETDKTFGNIASGKGSKGSSGSNGKTYDKEDLKTLKDVEDRYHNINRAIERQDDLLDDLSNATSRAWGNEAIKGYEKEIKALEDQQTLYNKKLVEAQGYLKDDSALVKKYFADAQIGADDEITNYEALLRENLKLYNAAVLRYNQAVDGKTLSEEQYNALKNQLDAEKTLFDQRQEALSQYESTLDEVRDTTDKIQENARSIADKKLEEIKFKIEIVLDVKSMEDALRDFDKDIAEMFGDALTHGIKSAKLSAVQAQAEAALFPSYQEELKSLQDLYDSTSDAADRKSIMEEIEPLQGKILDSAKAIAEWANSIEDLIPDAVDAAAERFSAFTDQLDHNTSVLDTIKELYALQGVTYKTADGFNRLQKNSQEKLEAQVASAQLQRGWYEEASKRLEEAQAKLDSLNGDETDIRYDTYKKARDAYLEEFNDAQEAYLSSAKDAMETAQEMYLQQIEKAAYAFGQAVSDNVGLDLLQDKYDHYIETEERYFDKVNEAYQVSAWYNKLQKDIDDTTNVAYKNRLKALQEEIDQRKEGNKLSQYDLDILNAKYQVLQAQQALEEAQNNKNKLQLVRDSQGNWNYQFTADEDAIANAEQDVLDAQNNWYNIAKDRTKEVAGEIVSMWQDCTDAVEQLYKDLANGDITEEEYLKKKAEIEEYYTEKAKYLEEEKNEAIKDMNEAGYEALKEIAEKNGETVEDFKNVYADELNSMTDSNKNFADYLNDYLDQCKKGFDNYQDTVSNVADKTGTDLDNLAQETDKVSKATDELKDRGLEAKDSLWEMVDATSNLTEEQLTLAEALQDVIDKMRTMAGLAGKTGASNGYDKNTDYSDVIRDGLANGWLQYGSDEYNELVKQRNAKIKDLNLGQYDMSDEDFKNSTGSGAYTDRDAWLKKMRELGVTGFATGGYTGSFDDEKLAFLHQKELVLNQEDTANILAAVQAVRTIGADLFKSIEKTLDGNAIAAMALVGQKLNPVAGTQVQGAIEQTVHIDKVEFPNATSRTEIEEAFVSLTNDAAQWAKRRTQ